MADIERKLDLYKAMFYHNTQSDRDSNFITSESLKIELIAGGLNMKQQAYIMEKMEPNDFGDVSADLELIFRTKGFAFWFVFSIDGRARDSHA